MRSLLPLVLSGGLLGCGSSPRAVPDGAPPDMVASPTTVEITTGVPAALVAFRDGVTGPWQVATRTSSTQFEVVVQGPYVVAVVCDDTRSNIGGTFHTWDTFETGRTLADPHAFTECDVPVTGHAVTGHMVQAGTVVMGDQLASSATANWNFKLSVASGTYDLIATTIDGLAIKRGIAVAGDVQVTPAVDVAAQGTALGTAAFTVTNTAAGETLRAAVFLETGTNSQPANLYNAAPATAKVAPEAALVASDVQTVSLRALSTTPQGTMLRAFRRPFRVGGNTSYTLPAAIGNPQWTVAATQAELAWTALPVQGMITESLSGVAPGGAVTAAYTLELTPSFVAATAPTKAVIDTDIPGYQAAWRVDTGESYDRQMSVQHIENGEFTSLTIDQPVATVR